MLQVRISGKRIVYGGFNQQHQRVELGQQPFIIDQQYQFDELFVVGFCHQLFGQHYFVFIAIELHNAIFLVDILLVGIVVQCQHRAVACGTGRGDAQC